MLGITEAGIALDLDIAAAVALEQHEATRRKHLAREIAYHVSLLFAKEQHPAEFE